ncbi:MAG: hypothetical protein ACXADH_00170 [Candidatus Kariarchaeaceae archaeon]|jgi:hypothetical protein
MTSKSDRIYVPFWILLEYLDKEFQDPWIEVQVIKHKQMNASSPQGPVEVECCDLLISNKPGLIAYNIPCDYLINADDIEEWSQKIADWFTNYKSKTV